MQETLDVDCGVNSHLALGRWRESIVYQIVQAQLANRNRIYQRRLPLYQTTTPLFIRSIRRARRWCFKAGHRTSMPMLLRCRRTVF
jgi:hypothetical protein